MYIMYMYMYMCPVKKKKKFVVGPAYMDDVAIVIFKSTLIRC